MWRCRRSEVIGPVVIYKAWSKTAVAGLGEGLGLHRMRSLGARGTWEGASVSILLLGIHTGELRTG